MVQVKICVCLTNPSSLCRLCHSSYNIIWHWPNKYCLQCWKMTLNPVCLKSLVHVFHAWAMLCVTFHPQANICAFVTLGTVCSLSSPQSQACLTWTTVEKRHHWGNVSYSPTFYLLTHCFFFSGSSASKMDVSGKYLWVRVHFWEWCVVLWHLALGNLLTRYVYASIVSVCLSDYLCVFRGA